MLHELENAVCELCLQGGRALQPGGVRELVALREGCYARLEVLLMRRCDVSGCGRGVYIETNLELFLVCGGLLCLRFDAFLQVVEASRENGDKAADESPVSE